MSTFAWVVTFIWPIAVVFGYSFIVDGTLKERAEVLSEHYNQMGKALQTLAKELVAVKARMGLDEKS